MRTALWILVPSLGVVLASHVAFEVFPTHWGGPNIGGGVLLLVAYLGVAIGLLRVRAARRRRE